MIPRCLTFLLWIAGRPHTTCRCHWMTPVETTGRVAV